MVRIRVTDHAGWRLRQHGIDIDTILHVLEHPESMRRAGPGRIIVQSIVPAGEPPKEYLVRVILDVDRDPIELVTAYRTSKLRKYRSQQP